MIKIWFKDTDWNTDSGNVVKMSEPNYFYVNSRLMHIYTAPIILEDTWDGLTHPVQKEIFEAYQMQVAFREIGMTNIAKIQACKTLWIESLETNEIIEIDTRVNGGVLVEPLGRLGTANQSFMITVKANRALSFPAFAALNTHHLAITYNSTTYDYYTDFGIIDFVSDAEQSQYGDASGINYTAKSVNRIGKRLVFYLDESDMLELKKYSELAEPAGVALNTTIVPAEVLKCVVTQLATDLYKCEIELIISSNVNYPYVALS